ncbi:MAG TPA: anti-sigma factor antagonist [Chloroflexi bacterium]|nr:anti-sigma factor antagonist [Chloroflexota bacterium]
MTPKPFSAQVRIENQRVVIDLQGEINAQADEALNLAYAEADSQNPKVIVLNFSGVDYINSTGIALIVGLLAQTRKTHRRLVVYGLSEHYVQIFQITRLSDFMDIFQDETSALMN